MRALVEVPILTCAGHSERNEAQLYVVNRASAALKRVVEILRNERVTGKIIGQAHTLYRP